MARGITESDVHTAADELVANGDRPTVERIRVHLGTGSPNTVTRWLDTWWKNLGTRLQPKRPDLKDAPVVLAELAGQWWALALQHARESVLEELAAAKQSLANENDELHALRQTFADEAIELRSKAETALQAERLASTQAVELQRLVSQLQARNTELTQQRTEAAHRLDQMESSRDTLDARLQQLQELARSERESLVEHARSVENRALVDVDRARQEVKDLRTQLLAMTKDSASKQAHYNTQMDALRTSTAIAEREMAVQRIRRDGLEQELASLQGLSAALKTALESTKAAKKPTVRRKSRVASSTGGAPDVNG